MRRGWHSFGRGMRRVVGPVGGNSARTISGGRASWLTTKTRREPSCDQVARPIQRCGAASFDRHEPSGIGVVIWLPKSKRSIPDCPSLVSKVASGANTSAALAPSGERVNELMNSRWRRTSEVSPDSGSRCQSSERLWCAGASSSASANRSRSSGQEPASSRCRCLVK